MAITTCYVEHMPPILRHTQPFLWYCENTPNQDGDVQESTPIQEESYEEQKSELVTSVDRCIQESTPIQEEPYEEQKSRHLCAQESTPIQEELYEEQKSRLVTMC